MRSPQQTTQPTATTHEVPSGARIDPAGLSAMIQRYQAGVWRYLRSLGCSRAEADDLVQETFLAVWEHPFQNRGPAATAAYLRTIARHRLISARRRSGRVIVTDQMDRIDRIWEEASSDDEENGQALLRALRSCLDRLTDRARQALAMRYRDGRRRREIAETLAMTEHGVRNLLQRAKQRLRTCIEQTLS